MLARTTLMVVLAVLLVVGCGYALLTGTPYHHAVQIIDLVLAFILLVLLLVP